MLRTTSLISLAIGLASPALSQGLDSRVAQLERQLSEQQSRIDELESEPTGSLSTDVSGVELTFGGRINAMILFADQGPNDQSFVADNDASGSRLEFLAETAISDGLTAGLEIVVSAEINSSDRINFGSNEGSSDEEGPAGDFRQAHFFVESDRFGYISLGQGDTAAEDTAHVDLSGTDFAGSGSDVDDIAGGLHFFDEDGNDLAELDDFFDMQDGSRAVRALYVTPDFGGFSVAISAANSDSGSDGDEDLNGSGLQPALGLNYGGELAFGELEAALSWRREVLDDDRNNDFVVASGSLLLASGFNVTLAASRGDIEGQDEDPNAYFAKIGYRAQFFEIGETRFSIDYFRGENAADFAAPGGDLVEASSWGLFAVQDIPAVNTEAYVGIRRYELDNVYFDGAERDVDEMTAILAGARVRF